MSNLDKYGLLGVPAAFTKFCKSQKSCSKCPVAKAKANAFRLRAEGTTYQSCIGAFSNMDGDEP